MERRYYAAPMEGVTTWIFRRAHHRWFGGVDRYYMPFLSPSQDHCFTKRELREVLPQQNEGVPAVPQLLTRRSADFLWAAGELSAMGYDEVDLNLGCPSGTVVAKGKGSGLLAFPEELDHFLDEIFSGTELSISIKTRLGRYEQEEWPRLLEIYNRYPIRELIVHPRIQRDLYRAPVRLEGFRYGSEHSRAPVCYNGDLFTGRDCAAVETAFPQAAALMTGRGLIMDPGLLSRHRGGTGTDRVRLRGFLTEIYDGYTAAFDSRRNAMLRMKELWAYLLALFQDSERLGKRLRKATDPAQFDQIMEEILRELPLREEACSPFGTALPLQGEKLFEN